MEIKSMYRAFESIGIKVLSDEVCCQLLAFFYAFGTEDFITNKRLQIDLQEAQKRLNIIDGKFPNSELIPILQNYVKKVTTYKGGERPDWLEEIAKKYNVKLDDDMNMNWNTPKEGKKKKR